MNIPNIVHFRTNLLVKEEKSKKQKNQHSKLHFREDENHDELKKISKSEFEHGDPDFVDERVTKKETKEK